MKKLLLAVLALMMIASYSDAFAQKATLRLGGGIITDGTVPGGGLGLVINREDNPLAFGITGEFYSKSGAKTIPAGVVGLYQKANENGNMKVFFGVGGGVFYSKVSIGAFSASTTKGMATGLGGVQFDFSPKAGVYVKGQYYRALTSGAANTISIGGGIAINIGGE